jgi:hypothetical protein
MAPETAATELAELVRDLHQLLESQAPLWYTEKMDARLSESLAAASCVLAKTAE